MVKPLVELLLSLATDPSKTALFHSQFQTEIHDIRDLHAFVLELRSGNYRKKQLGIPGRRAVSQWLHSHTIEDLKKQITLHGVDLKLVITVSHPKPQDKEYERFFGDIVKGVLWN